MNILQYILPAHKHTYTQYWYCDSISKIYWMCVVTACAGEWQPRGGAYFSVKVGKPCAPERSVREWYSEKVHVPLYQLNDGFCRRGRLHRGGHAWRLGKADRSMTTLVCNVVQRSLSSLSMRQHFSLTYKTIAAGRARGLFTSRKKKKNNKQKKNINEKNNYNITSPSNPHEKQAMEIHQFWEAVSVFNLFSFPLNPNLQATNIVLC